MPEYETASDWCPAPHLEAADLNGGDVKVTIESFSREVVGAEQEECPTIKFKEFNRTMVVNKTNKNRLVRHFGNRLPHWVGKEVTLYPSETDFGGKTVPCIRVREK